MNKVINGGTNIFGSDEQNFNQDNIDYDDQIELRLNREAMHNQQNNKKSGNKSVEILDKNNMDLSKTFNGHKRRRGRPKKNSN